MKKLALLAIFSSLFISTTALADSIEGEVKFSNIGPANGKGNTEEYKLKYTETLSERFDLSVETNLTQEGRNLKADLVGGVSYKLPTIEGFKPKIFVEVGQVLSSSDYTFWSVGAKVSKRVYGPVSLAVGYRYRDGFNKANSHQNRIEAGLDFDIDKNWTLGARYYRYSGGTSRRDSVAVLVKHEL